MKENKTKYPVVEVDLTKLHQNLAVLKKHCQICSIDIAGVVKGFNAIPEIAKVYEDIGVSYIASSRLEHLKCLREHGIKTPLMHIRIAMPDEIEELVEIAELSLQSELKTIEHINTEAQKQNKIHKVILMVDLGDLREGCWDIGELLHIVSHIEEGMKNIDIAGIGTNLGCYGSIKATPEKLQELVEISRRIESETGKKIEIISGGASSSLYNIIEGKMPEGINQLRIGEAILFGTETWGYNFENLHSDVFLLKTQIIEIKTKPSFPVGERSVDAFGNLSTYVDKGIRKRALVAVGKVDYGDPFGLKPIEDGMEVIGASSDHTIIDIEFANKELQIGDIVEFKLEYSNLVYLANTKSVSIDIRDIDYDLI